MQVIDRKALQALRPEALVLLLEFCKQRLDSFPGNLCFMYRVEQLCRTR